MSLRWSIAPRRSTSQICIRSPWIETDSKTCVNLQGSSMGKVAPVIVMVLAITEISHSYFDYKTDCNYKCQKRQLPCTISEYSPTHFPNECIITNHDCVDMAGPQVVCLRPGGLKPVGGQEIWIPYWNYTHPQPKPSPKPSSNDESLILKIYAAVLTTLVVLQWGSAGCRSVMATMRRHRYERLEASTAPPAGTPDSRPNPYQNPTTVDI